MDASSINLASGLYYKVEDMSDIQVGDKIIFVSASSGKVFDDIWGNPGCLHGTGTGIISTNNGHLAYLTDRPTAVFTVGTSDYTKRYDDVPYEGDIYAFKTALPMTSRNKEDEVYLAQNKKDSPFPDMGQF